MARSGTYGYRLEGREGKEEIQGLREVQKALNKFSDATRKEMKSTHLKAAEIVVGASKKFVPIKTGALAQSIRAAAVQTGGRVKVGSPSVPYAGPIHFGWPARSIKPQPFIYDALDTRRGDVSRLYAVRIGELVIKYDLGKR
jgi:hypothetical protein